LKQMNLRRVSEEMRGCEGVANALPYTE
jgi:hypothetical protein